MIADPQVQLEMSYCGPRGISHSHFLGGPPVWTALDRDLALWWEIHRREACPSCGTRPDEWDPKVGGDLHAYEAQPVHCRGCEVTAQGEDWLERNRDNLRRGTSMQLRPTPDPEAQP